MRSASSVLILASAIALAALPPPAAAAEDIRIASEVRELCVYWDADAGTPKAYELSAGQACAVAKTIDAPTDAPENIAFARLDYAIRQLQADVDAIDRRVPEPAPLRWQITAAGPNHLYYAAHSLLRYTNGVAGVAGGAHGSCLVSAAPEKNAATLDVVVDAVECVNNQLRKRFGTSAAASAASGVPRQTAGEPALQVAARLLARLMATGRRLDAALPVETTSNDIYHRLEDAARNLAGLAAESLPPLPAPSKVKDAADVYQLVFRCLRLSQVLEVKRNIETRQRSALALSQWHGVDVAPNSPSLQINPAKNASSASVALADVYDLATLLAAQLGAIGEGGNPDAIYPRPPEPTLSDVFRLASALEARLMKMTGITGRR